MTVVAALITKNCTVHACDSLLTVVEPGGKIRQVEWEETKIVPVPHWRGAMAYYGFAGWRNGWQTATWLRDRASHASDHASPQEFATALARDLQVELVRGGVAGNPGCGIGIHFSSYEWIADRRIPELFHIANWKDADYRELRSEGVSCSRETWGLIKGVPSSIDHSSEGHRLAVAEFLLGDGWLRYNNGDPALFNTVANAVQSAVMVLEGRGQLHEMRCGEHAAVVRRTVELVGRLQGDIGLPDRRRVGGRTHDLAITPEGTYSSTSGDEP